MNSESREQAQQAIDVLFRFFSNSPRTVQDLGELIDEKIFKLHATAQQQFWRMIQYLAGEYAKIRQTDGRNEDAKAFAKAISEINISLPFI